MPQVLRVRLALRVPLVLLVQPLTQVPRVPQVFRVQVPRVRLVSLSGPVLRVRRVLRVRLVLLVRPPIQVLRVSKVLRVLLVTTE